jgi:hypothetical protein
MRIPLQHDTNSMKEMCAQVFEYNRSTNKWKNKKQG